MRVAEFEDAISCASGVDLKVLPENSHNFSASMCSHAMGRLSLSEVECDSAVIERPSHGNQNNRYFVMVQLAGTGIIRYGANEFKITPGDFFVADSGDSYQNIFESRVRRLVIRMDRNDLLARLPQPASLCGRRIEGNNAIARVFGRLLNDLTVEAPNLNMHARAILSSSILDILALAVQSTNDNTESRQSSRRRANRERILEYISANLCNPQLDTGLIARELKVSTRYVQHVFEFSGTTVRDVVREQRLQQCYEWLLEPRLDDNSVSEIAFKAGFNSFEHFCRAFKTRYGMTPRSVRLKRT